MHFVGLYYMTWKWIHSNLQFACVHVHPDTNMPNVWLIDPQPYFITSMYTYTDMNT
jgi:hypothetical protein